MSFTHASEPPSRRPRDRLHTSLWTVSSKFATRPSRPYLFLNNFIGFFLCSVFYISLSTVSSTLGSGLSPPHLPSTVFSTLTFVMSHQHLPRDCVLHTCHWTVSSTLASRPCPPTMPLSRVLHTCLSTCLPHMRLHSVLQERSIPISTPVLVKDIGSATRDAENQSNECQLFSVSCCVPE